jgi:hypothetical protein
MLRAHTLSTTILTVPMLAVYEGKNNEIVNARLYYDNSTFMRQLGQASQ